MNTYVITFIGNNLFYGYTQIGGKNPVDAFEKVYHRKIKRVYGEECEYADIVLVKGRLEGDILKYGTRYRKYFYRYDKDGSD